ncbi:MAG TPA: hypothetical protein VIB39_10230 [Candidatus Angelobacter sp.]|jgi:drug/metabolite transporter (DMT)-like permease
MQKLARASMIGLVSGAVCFVILAALLVIVLLIIGARGHTHPDMALSVKVALPVAVITTIAGFIIALVRLGTIDKDK